jgi:hypothetical protein
MQRSLGFARIDAHEHRQQTLRIAQEVAEHLPSAPPPPEPKRAPGRPKTPRSADEALGSAAAAAALPDSKRARSHVYTHWLLSPYINDILAAFQRTGSFKRAVTVLQREAPDDRYAHLSHSTIRGWFGPDRQLLPHVQRQLGTAATLRGGRGPTRVLSEAPLVEAEIKRVLLEMRTAGAPVNSRVIRWVMHAVMQRMQPALLNYLTLSQSFISDWAREQMQWRWRSRTTAASKLPLDWEEQGVRMAMRIASSLDGGLLPLQLIFQGKTDRVLPPRTAASIAVRVDLTMSDNHWSSQLTMQRYIAEVIMPHAERSIRLHQLDADAKIILVLDAWAVHRSAEFRAFLRAKHPRIHLVFVPANCTSKLQVADVALQRPFKHGISTRFNQWAAEQVAEQIEAGDITGVADQLKMGVLKPLVLQWCVESWSDLCERKQLIIDGWGACCTKLFNVNNPAKRIEAVVAVAAQKLDLEATPAEDEQVYAASSESDDELDTSKPITYGKRTGRARKQPTAFGYKLDSSAIESDSDSF